MAIPDAQKGEQLVLLTEQVEAVRNALLAHAHTRGIAEIHVPRQLVVARRLPLLGSGKTDYTAARDHVNRELGI